MFGARSHDSSFSDSREITLALSELVLEEGVVRGVVSELQPGTSYELRVAAVNGAAIAGGIGVLSPTVTALTNSGKPLSHDLRA